MKGHFLTEEIIQRFEHYLKEHEKSENTIEKYIRDIRAFGTFLGRNEVIKEAVII